MILIEFLPKYPILRPDWGGCERLDVWPLNLILSALYIHYVGTRVCTAVSRDNPVHLPVPCTLKFATLSLCFRADFAHFPNRTRRVAFVALGCVFVTWQTSETLEKCIYPKEPSTCVPSIISVIPCKECDASTFLNYPCLIVYLFKNNSRCNRRRKALDNKSADSNAVCWVSSLWIQFFASRRDGWNCLTYSVRRHSLTFSLHLTLCTWELASKRTWPVNTMLG